MIIEREIDMNRESNLEHYKEEIKKFFRSSYYDQAEMQRKFFERFCKFVIVKPGTFADCFSDCVLEWMTQPYREPILNGEEAEYLLEVIDPFRDMVESIYKCNSHKNDNVIRIDFKFDKSELYRKSISFPLIEGKLMYKGMEVDKHYTLEELGL